MNQALKLESMSVIRTSSQQMNSVKVDNWFSFPIALGLPPKKKSRPTKIGLFGRCEFTSSVSKLRKSALKLGPVVRLVYRTSSATCPLTGW